MTTCACFHTFYFFLSTFIDGKVCQWSYYEIIKRFFWSEMLEPHRGSTLVWFVIVLFLLYFHTFTDRPVQDLYLFFYSQMCSMKKVWMTWRQHVLLYNILFLPSMLPPQNWWSILDAFEFRELTSHSGHGEQKALQL